MKSEVVKVCPFCGQSLSLGDIVSRANVEAIGMMFTGDNPGDNAYFFNHVCPGCGTTFTVPVEAFAHLIEETIPTQLLRGTDECDGHCTRLMDLEECDNPCQNAPYRRFLVRVLRPPRDPTPAR